MNIIAVLQDKVLDLYHHILSGKSCMLQNHFTTCVSCSSVHFKIEKKSGSDLGDQISLMHAISTRLYTLDG